MPLVIMCGTPLSGKSYRAKQLHNYFCNTITDNNKCVLISDEEKLKDYGLNQLYKSASLEKELRSWLKSEVQRSLSLPKTIVILDAANSIKGYRYELYCLSKEFRTTHVVIECEEAPFELIQPMLSSNTGYNDNNNNSNKRAYNLEIFTELVQRFEKPNPNNRWDSPLFKLPYYCDVDSNKEQLQFEQIKDAIMNRAALKPNQSTQSLPVTTDNFLYELDSQTQQVIKQIQTTLQNNQFRDIHVSDTDLTVNLTRKVPIAELNKLRRQFINYTRMHPFEEKERIISAFVQFINKSFT